MLFSKRIRDCPSISAASGAGIHSSVSFECDWCSMNLNWRASRAGEQYQVAALMARAAGASAAVDEGFEVLRQSVLYDVADGVDVEAAGRYVGRDEYGDAAAAQRGERVVALALAHVAVYRGGAEADVAEPVGYILRFCARSAEEQRLARILPYKDVDKTFKAFCDDGMM